MIRSLIVAIALIVGVALPARADLGTALAAYEGGDYATAIKEFELLAKQGDERAEYQLGLIYAEGRGVPRDTVTALVWFTCSAAQGRGAASAKAARWRDRLVRSMSADSIAEAGRRAARCPEKIHIRHKETYGPPALPPRLSWTARVFFAPGDALVSACLDLARVLVLPALRDTVRYLISHYGDAFLGLIAVLMWMAFLGLAILAKRIFDSLRRPAPPQSYIYEPAETHRRRDRSESSVEESNAPAGAVAARPGRRPALAAVFGGHERS